MKILKIELMGTHKPIATVYSNLDGTFKVVAKDIVAKDHISRLIDKISKENPVLFLLTGDEIKEDGKIINRTLKKEVPVTDIEYLLALADFISKKENNYIFKQERLRGYTVDIDDKDRES